MAGNRALAGATQPRDTREVTDPGSSCTAHPRAGSRCRIRVIDTFGTEPAYNHEEYATLHGYRTNWGYWNLNPKQFMTMFRESWPQGMGGVRGRRGVLVVLRFSLKPGRRRSLLAFLPGLAQAPAHSGKAWLALRQVCEPERKSLAVSGEQLGWWGFRPGLGGTWRPFRHGRTWPRPPASHVLRELLSAPSRTKRFW